MSSFSFSGGVEVLGFISPTDTNDTYPVIDPLYGIDGFRNVNTLSDLNTIPNLRRRAGMVVGISGGTQYYKLNPGPWVGTISDWSIFNSGGGSFTGGTVTGNTIFTSGVTATTLNVNGVFITGNTYTTGGTYSNGIITFDYNTSGDYQVTGLYTGQTSYVNSLTTGVGLSADTTTGNVTLINTAPDQVVTISGGTNLSIVGTYPNFGVEFTGSTSSFFTGGTVSGATNFTNGLSANTFSATTISGGTLYGDGSNLTGIPDYYLTGLTFDNGTYFLEALVNDGNTYQANLSILGGDLRVTGGTYNPATGIGTFTNNSGATFDVSGFLTGYTDHYVTGFTYDNINTFTIYDNSGSTFNATINTVTGLTVNGILSATTISGGTLYGDGSNLTGLSSGLNVGVTQITNGTSGRVLFQSGTTLQQDTNFNYDATLKRLTLRAVGVTSSDIPFVIQSSGGTFNLMDIVGTGDINFRTSNTGATGIINMSKDGNGAPTMYLGSPAFGYKWHNFYTAYVFSPLDGNNGYEGRIDLGRYNGAVRTRFVCAGDSFLQYSNLVLGATTAGARLDVRAQGTLSTDIAFRVRNSGDTNNIFTVRGDGFVGINTDTPRSNGTYSSVGLAIKNGATEIFSTYNEGGVALGAGATVTNFSGAGNIITGVAIGLNTYSWQNSVSIGPSSTANSTSTISIGQSNTVGGSAGVRLIALGSSIDANTTSGSGSDNIAIGSSLITGRDNNLNIVIGTHLGNRFNFGGSLSVNRNIYIGGYLDQATNSRNNIITLGYGVSSVSKITPSIDNSFQIYFSDNERSFFVNKNSNVVLRSLQTLVTGTNYDTSATNTITISTGTTPSTNIIDSSQIYVTDRGGTAGRASLHVRSEDGTINVLGDLSGIGTSTPGARLDVRAQGVLSTDIAFRVRNSGDTANLVSVTGEGVLNLANLGDTSRIAINATTLGQLAIAIGSGQSGLRTTCVGFGNTANGQDGNIFGYGNNGVSLGACGTIFGSSNTHTIGIVVGSSNSGSGSVIVGSNNAIGGSGPTNNAMFVFGAGMTETSGDALLPGTFMFGSYTTTGNKAGLTFKSRDKNHLLLGYDIMNATYSSQNGTNWLGVKSGTAPDGAIDAFQLYSADITAGNAAPHFRTENGSIVKLYQETTGVTTSTLISNAGTTITDTDTFDGYTLQQIVKALRNLGVLQ
jgi:hypothetical protein